MIMDSGLALTTNLLLSGTTPRITHFAIGSGTVAPQFLDMALGAESYRVAVTYGHMGSPFSGDTYSGAINSVQSYGIGSITEQSLWTSGTSGLMFNRATHNAVFLDVGSDWFFDWDVVVL